MRRMCQQAKGFALQPTGRLCPLNPDHRHSPWRPNVRVLRATPLAEFQEAEPLGGVWGGAPGLPWHDTRRDR